MDKKNQSNRGLFKSSSFSVTALCRPWLAGSVLALLCVAGPVNAGQQVPFHATFAGVDYASFPDACAIVVRHIDEGTATHLGQSTYTSTTISDACSGSLLGSDEDVVITAANGDQLFGSSVDISNVVDASDPSKVRIVGQSIITITGGTGRFVNSSGLLLWSFVANLYQATPLPDGSLAVPNYFSLDGTLSSVGSNQ